MRDRNLFHIFADFDSRDDGSVNLHRAKLIDAVKDGTAFRGDQSLADAKSVNFRALI